MPKTPKRPRDLNQWARSMVDLATGAVGKARIAGGNEFVAEIYRDIAVFPIGIARLPLSDCGR